MIGPFLQDQIMTSVGYLEGGVLTWKLMKMANPFQIQDLDDELNTACISHDALASPASGIQAMRAVLPPMMLVPTFAATLSEEVTTSLGRAECVTLRNRLHAPLPPSSFPFPFRVSSASIPAVTNGVDKFYLHTPAS